MTQKELNTFRRWSTEFGEVDEVTELGQPKSATWYFFACSSG